MRLMFRWRSRTRRCGRPNIRRVPASSSSSSATRTARRASAARGQFGECDGRRAEQGDDPQPDGSRRGKASRSPESGGSASEFNFDPGGPSICGLRPSGPLAHRLKISRALGTNREHASFDPRGQLYPCGLRPPSSLCAPRFGKSRASIGAPRRRCPSVSQRSTRGSLAARCRWRIA